MNYILGVLALLVALLGGESYLQHQALAKARGERDTAVSALAVANTNAKRIAKISDARQVKINQLALSRAATQRKLDEALKANREWASAPVPAGVWNALGYPADAGQAGPGVDAASPGASAAGPGQRGLGTVGPGSP